MRLGLSSGLSTGGFVGSVSPIDPATLNPYLYFRADPAAGGSITTVGGSVSEWTQVTTSGGNQIDRTLGQTVANQQPQHDNTDKHITFDASDDDLDFTSSGSISAITQAGIYFSATKRGVWVQENKSTSIQTVDALGPAAGFYQTEDVYAIVLLPNTLTDAQIEGVVLWLLENTNAQKTTHTLLDNYRRSQTVALRHFSAGIDTSNVNHFNSTWNSNSNITSFPKIDTSSGISFHSAWKNCSSLTSFPLLDTSSAISLASAWYNCSSLTSFPEIDCSSATDMGGTWRECDGLTSFPALDCSSTTNFTLTWYNCRSLVSIGAIDTSSGTTFNSTWRNCQSLTSFPSIDTSSGTYFGLAWYNCRSITSFPALDVSSGTSFQYAWGEMRSLTAFPTLDVSNGTNFAFTWYRCESLTSFPSLNINKGRSFIYAWNLCTSLTDFPANFFDSWNPTSITTGVFDLCWDRCDALTATSVENILVSIAASGKHGTDDGSSSGTALADATIDIDYNASTGSLSAATNTAINTLISRGWSVKINGVLTVPSLLALSPAAAYSLRSFDSSADPNVVNVRRSSDNATQDFKASENTDGTLATWVGSGNDGFIATWYDQSGNTVNATQTVAAEQPKIVSSGTVVLENSKPAIDFDGSSSELIMGSTVLNSTDTRNYSAVFTTSDDQGVVVGGHNGGFANTYGNALYINDSKIKAKALNNGSGILLDSGVTVSGTYLATAEIISGNAALYVNGVEKATSTQAPFNWLYSNLIGASQYGSRYLDGTIQEIVIYDTDQSDNRTPIENNINTHYSIY